MSQRLPRRTFLFGSLAAATLGPSVARAAFAADRLRLGIIGTGGQGAFSWNSVADQDVRVLCDVDLARTADAKQRFPGAEVVQDFRRVIDRNDLDAVTVATPDHWHSIPSIWAMQSGKHVYCEKPLAHSVHEVRVMREAAKRHKRVTQMGTQIHAGSNYRRVVELVRAGAIGRVKRVDVWCEKQPSPGKLPGGDAKVPTTLDYDLWVGPAPRLAYSPSIVPFNWRWWWQYGGGVLADMACHYMDLPHWALDLRSPERVVATGTRFPDADNTVPVEMRVDYHHAAKGDRGPVQVVWWHGIRGPRDEQGQIRSTGMSSGVLFHGEEGELLADYDHHKLLPEEKFRDYQRPAPSIPDSIGHHKEWLEAIRSGGPTTCNFDYSGALSETVLLGNVAYRLGREIRWDGDRMRVTNVRREDWEPLVAPPLHGDWKLER